LFLFWINGSNEDLNISVVLTTFKKGRTILTADKESGKNSFNTQGNISINFIDGSNINGKQVLTTNYTDLTTIFDDNTTNNAAEIYTSVGWEDFAGTPIIVNVEPANYNGSSGYPFRINGAKFNSDAQIRVIDQTGREILGAISLSNGSKIDLSSINKGLYSVEITNNGVKSTKNIVVE
jgi:hypothetical protein